MNARRALAVPVLALAALAASAATPTAPRLEAAWIALPPPGARVAAGYLVIDNRGGAPLVVTGARAAGFARAEVHETVREGARMRMRPRPALAVAADARVAFAPGALHLMLWDPALPPRAGAAHLITLVLADGRELAVRAEVRDVRNTPPKG